MIEYEKAAPLMETGDLIGTSDDSLIARGIKAVTKHKINHVCGIVVVGGRRVVLQTTLDVNRVHAVPLSRFIASREKVFWWRGVMNETQKEIYTNTLFDALGAKYEKPLLMLTRVALRRPFKENDRWFCSELEARARSAADSTLAELLPSPQRSWPSHVVEAYGGLRLAVQIK
jgi:hypothetical protein